jgi:hypothetical protein
MGRRFNTAGLCLPAFHYMIPALRRLPEAPGLDKGVLVVFDRRPDAAAIADRTTFHHAATPSGRPVTILRA